MTTISVENIYKIFGRNPKRALEEVKAGKDKENLLADTGHTLGLKDISLEIEGGQTFVIMGLSGSGKSTLIRHFNRLIEPTSGDIKVGGKSVMSMSDTELLDFRRHKISMVFQRFGLLPHHTVIDNVAYGLQVQGVGKSEREDKARYWIDVVGLAGYENSYPDQLSGGMQQRVGLARALCTDPEILLMDEAFSALDPLIRREMQDQLIELQAKLNKTIIFITHDLDEALRLGNRIAILKDGVIQQVGTPQQILLEPANEYVNAFVQDINRTKVLTASLALAPANTLSSKTSVSDALSQLSTNPDHYAYVVDDEQHLLGIVDEEGLRGSTSGSIESHMRPIEGVHETDVLDEVMEQLAHSDYHLPVLDGEERLTGVLSAESTIKALTDDHGNSDGKAPSATEMAEPSKPKPAETA
ncbi:quaternary amine ABC transporter ATP-binding protein [Pokkaliibacter sp. CJK22405]|uniref:quaternary amine ABC transporter ATP-binding protein n=1 Tax=Pokkaliibacter sp. CJK22405 TaxID=3384615 RepID=UPI003984C957